MIEQGKRMTDKTVRTLEIVRIFDAPRAMVFQAWADPRQMTQWSAPHGYQISASQGEVRAGAAWCSCMRSPDGEELWLSGVYREVVENEKLVFTHAWDQADGTCGHETVVTVVFEDLGDKTRMIFRQELFENVEQRDGHGEGWNECFDKLADHLAQRSRAGAGA